MNPPWHRAGRGSRTTLQLRGVCHQFWIKFATHSPLALSERIRARCPVQRAGKELAFLGHAELPFDGFQPLRRPCSGSNVYLR